MEIDATRGSVWKTMRRFALPYLCSYFLQTLYGMADLFIDHCPGRGRRQTGTGSLGHWEHRYPFPRVQSGPGGSPYVPGSARSSPDAHPGGGHPRHGGLFGHLFHGDPLYHRL